jgi:glycosyltransferase involved in cell wall biosynthesis
MIEAMLTGTPVIAFASGSAPEIVDKETTGVLVRDVDAMADAIPRAASFDRARCRAGAVARFSAARMAHEYLDAYADIATRGDAAVWERRRVASAK